MSDLLNALANATSGMKAQGQRLRHVSENIANADTPGFRRKSISFEAVYDGGNRTAGVETGRVHLDQADLAKHYDPSHPMADSAGYYDGSNVNLVVEIADSREAQRSFEANLKIFDQARKMASSLLDLLRR
mgnify:CR=1 FL=1